MKLEYKDIKRVSDAINDSKSISVMKYPTCVKTLMENEVIIKVDGCNKEFKISIEKV